MTMFPEYEGQPKHAKDYPAEETVAQPTPGLGGLDSNITPTPASGIVAKLGIPYKSIIGFFAVFIGQLLARATVNDIPVLPENGSGWFSLVGGSFVAAAVIYFKANVYTVPQAEKKVVAAEHKFAA